MEKEQLLELRARIVKSAREIALNGQGSPVERLQVLLEIIRAGDADLGVLTTVYELSQSIEDDNGKLSALLDVLYEVDAKLSDSVSEPETGSERVSNDEADSEQVSE